MNIDYLDIAKKLDLEKDDILIIASDITDIALHEWKEGRKFDAQKFINSFKERLFEGTLLFHAFNDNLVSGDTFDYKNSKPNTGILSVVAWKDTDFIRTHDPFHSFMVWGKRADELKNIDDVSTFGNNSVFGWLHQNRAKMLIISLHIVDCFTFNHYCEEKIKVHYRKYVKHKIHYIDENKQKSVVERLFYTRKSGYLNNFTSLEKSLLEKGIAQNYSFNETTFLLIDLEQTYNYIKDNIYPKGNLLSYKFSYKVWIKDVLKKILRRFHLKIH